MDKISKLLSELGISKVQMDTSKESDTEPKPEQLLNEVTFDGVAQYIRSGKCKCNNAHVLMIIIKAST